MTDKPIASLRSTGPGADDLVGTVRVHPATDPADRYARRYIRTDSTLAPWVPLTARAMAPLVHLWPHEVAHWPVQPAREWLAVLCGLPAVDLPEVLDGAADRAARLLAVALQAGRTAYDQLQPERSTDHIPDTITRAVIAAILTTEDPRA